VQPSSPLPDLTLLQLPVSAEHVDGKIVSVQPPSKGYAVGKGEPLPKRPGRRLDSGVLLMSGCPWRRVPNVLIVRSSSRGKKPSLERITY
jgi:hypothetical protein